MNREEHYYLLLSINDLIALLLSPFSRAYVKMIQHEFYLKWFWFLSVAVPVWAGT